jgi:hypothetical protein
MEEAHDTSHDHLLPVWQRLAWMAAIWTLSVGAMALVSLAIKAWLT